MNLGQDMLEKFTEEFKEHLGKAMQHNPLPDLEKNFKAILTSMLAKLDLVTREEFDIQQKILAQTKEKLEELEKYIGKHK